jgi:hypothetical protein
MQPQEAIVGSALGVVASHWSAWMTVHGDRATSKKGLLCSSGLCRNRYPSTNQTFPSLSALLGATFALFASLRFDDSACQCAETLASSASFLAAAHAMSLFILA